MNESNSIVDGKDRGPIITKGEVEADSSEEKIDGMRRQVRGFLDSIYAEKERAREEGVLDPKYSIVFSNVERLLGEILDICTTAFETCDRPRSRYMKLKEFMDIIRTLSKQARMCKNKAMWEMSKLMRRARYRGVSQDELMGFRKKLIVVKGNNSNGIAICKALMSLCECNKYMKRDIKRGEIEAFVVFLRNYDEFIEILITIIDKGTEGLVDAINEVGDIEGMEEADRKEISKTIIKQDERESEEKCLVMLERYFLRQGSRYVPGYGYLRQNATISEQKAAAIRLNKFYIKHD